ncbi:MAG: hypothetical protein V1891_01645 [bacterium]
MTISWLLAISPLNRSALEGGMIDIFTFLFGIESSFLLIDLFFKKNRKNQYGKIFLSSIFLGICLSAKYLGLFFALINSALLFLYHTEISIFGINFRKNTHITREITAHNAGFTQKENIFKEFIKYVSVAAMLSGFWYLKNFIFTGNIFFPLFSKTSEFGESIGRFVISRNILNFIIFPFVLLRKDNILKLPYAFFNACQFLLIYAMFIFLGLKKALGKPAIFLFIMIEIYLFFLFFWSHQIRFAVPALALLPVVGTLMLDKILELTENKIFLIKFYIPLSLIIISIALFSANTNYFKKEISCAGDSNNNKCFAERAGDGIYAIDFINENFKNETFLEYWHPFYNFTFKNGNKRSEYFCENKTHILNFDAIKNCLFDAKIKYLIDYTNKKPSLNNAAAKLAITQYFIKNGEILYETFDKERNIFTRIYKIN